jgi:hypothetical protein
VAKRGQRTFCQKMLLEKLVASGLQFKVGRLCANVEQWNKHGTWSLRSVVVTLTVDLGFLKT